MCVENKHCFTFFFVFLLVLNWDHWLNVKINLLRVYLQFRHETHLCRALVWAVISECNQLHNRLFPTAGHTVTLGQSVSEWVLGGWFLHEQTGQWGHVGDTKERNMLIKALPLVTLGGHLCVFRCCDNPNTRSSIVTYKVTSNEGRVINQKHFN